MIDHYLGGDEFVARTLLDHESTVEEPPGFRGSSLPVCPRRQVWNRTQGPIIKIRTFTERYQAAVGQALRRLVQETWAGQGLLWGDWACTALDCGTTFRETKTDGRCLRCRAPLRYQEVEVLDPGPGFAGHCHGVVWCDELDGYLAVAMKARNEHVIERYREPYPSDLLQASAYATLLARRYWLPIAGRLVLWIGKPRPKVSRSWFYPGLGDDLYDREVEALRRGERQAEAGREIEGTCKVRADARECQYGDQCFPGTDHDEQPARHQRGQATR